MRFHTSVFIIAIPSSRLVALSLVYPCKGWNEFLLLFISIRSVRLTPAGCSPCYLHDHVSASSSNAA
ncbi:hypothetical protein RU639_012399 [Aspergillus parasiticus]